MNGQANALIAKRVVHLKQTISAEIFFFKDLFQRELASLSEAELSALVKNKADSTAFRYMVTYYYGHSHNKTLEQLRLLFAFNGADAAKQSYLKHTVAADVEVIFNKVIEEQIRHLQLMVQEIDSFRAALKKALSKTGIEVLQKIIAEWLSKTTAIPKQWIEFPAGLTDAGLRNQAEARETQLGGIVLQLKSEIQKLQGIKANGQIDLKRDTLFGYDFQMNL